MMGYAAVMKVTTAAIAMAIAGSANLFAQAPAPFELPLPTGQFPIGTTRWVITDAARPEPFAPGQSRQVAVVAWYPAAAGQTGSPAPYLRESLAEVQSFAGLIRQPGVFDSLAGVQTHAVIDATPLAGPSPLPTLVFSHGYTAIPSSYTTLLEDLASHGYVVLSVVHPYEATAATLADGTVVTFLDEKGAMRKGIADVLAEWGTEDHTMARITDAKADDDRLALLRGYLSRLPLTGAALDGRVADLTLVIDRLSGLPAGSIGSRVAARIDTGRIGVFGHSMGGVTAGAFCLADARCRAGLNLDGIPQYGAMIDQTMPRPFLMVYSARPGRAGASDVIYRRATATYYRVDVGGTLHLDFSDMNFWGGPLRARGAYGTIAPARAADITRQIVREYFDQELLGQASPLLGGRTMLDGVTVQVMRQPK